MSMTQLSSCRFSYSAAPLLPLTVAPVCGEGSKEGAKQPLLVVRRRSSVCRADRCNQGCIGAWQHDMTSRWKEQTGHSLHALHVSFLHSAPPLSQLWSGMWHLLGKTISRLNFFTTLTTQHCAKAPLAPAPFMFKYARHAYDCYT